MDGFQAPSGQKITNLHYKYAEGTAIDKFARLRYTFTEVIKMSDIKQPICSICFKPLSDASDRCPNCGEYSSPRAFWEDSLKPFSRFDRFVIGMLCSDAEDECSYYAFDTASQKPVLLTVYFPHVPHSSNNNIFDLPKTPYGRGIDCSDIKIPPDKAEEYKKGKEKFAEKYSYFLNAHSPAIYHISEIVERDDIIAAVGEWVSPVWEKWEAIPDFQKVYNSAVPLMEYAERLPVPISLLANARSCNDLRDVFRTETGIMKFSPIGGQHHRAKSHFSDRLPHFTFAVEFYTGEPKITPATDVYNLCAIMYIAMTGKYSDTIGRVSAIMSTPPEEDPLIPPSELGAIISKKDEKVLLKGLRLRPEERWQSISEMRAAFESAEETEAENLHSLPKTTPAVDCEKNQKGKKGFFLKVFGFGRKKTAGRLGNKRAEKPK